MFRDYINEALLKDVNPATLNDEFQGIASSLLPKEKNKAQACEALERMLVKGADGSTKIEVQRFIEAVIFLDLLEDETLVDENAKCVLDAFCSVM